MNAPADRTVKRISVQEWFARYDALELLKRHPHPFRAQMHAPRSLPTTACCTEKYGYPRISCVLIRRRCQRRRPPTRTRDVCVQKRRAPFHHAIAVRCVKDTNALPRNRVLTLLIGHDEQDVRRGALRFRARAPRESRCCRGACNGPQKSPAPHFMVLCWHDGSTLLGRGVSAIMQRKGTRRPPRASS